MSAEGKTDNLKADVVIIGSGGGLAGAVAAAEMGASVILLEVQKRIGGYTKQANGLMAVESPVQKRDGISISKEEVFKTFVTWNHWNRINPRVVRAYVNKTGDTIRWLEEKGLSFHIQLHEPNNPKELRTGHMPKGMGKGLQDTLEKSARELGVNILDQTRGKKILRGSKGEVTGVMAEKGGKEFLISTKSVIIATGGFGDNRELLKKYCPDYYDSMPLDTFPGHEAHTGDGLLMAEEIGAAICGDVPIYHLGPYIPGYMYPWQSLPVIGLSPSAIWVNKKGRRFMDESYVAMAVGNGILLQPDKVMFSLFDDDRRRDTEEGGRGPSYWGKEVRKQADKGGGERVVDSSAGIPGLLEDLKAEAKKTGNVLIADSLDELARLIGCDPAALKEEMDAYNSYCDQGQDGMMSKNPEFLKPMRKAPFYAIKAYARVGETLGGIKTNEHMEILDKNGNVIPGVYAAGVLVDGQQGQTYNMNAAGSAMGFAVNSGRIAGENAAKFVKGK